MFKVLQKTLALITLAAISACSGGGSASLPGSAAAVQQPVRGQAVTRQATSQSFGLRQGAGVAYVKAQPPALRPAVQPAAAELARMLAPFRGIDAITRPCTVSPGSGTGDCIDFNSIPAGSLASDFASEGFECCQLSEFGTAVNLRRAGNLDQVSFVLDSWGCQNRAAPTMSGVAGVCTTTPGATFRLNFTLRVYAVAGSSPNFAVGTLLATKTTSFAIPYRPSDSPVQCPVQTLPYTNYWFDPVSQLCVHGLAKQITFNFGGSVAIPASAIFTVSYNTSDYGYAPVGHNTACYSTLAGCGYDSLNVIADSTGGLTAGSFVDPSSVFDNYALGSDYCDGGAGGVGILRFDQGCWTGYEPQLQVRITQT
jgi:hypothetical protein